MDIERVKTRLSHQIEKIDLFVQLLPRPFRNTDDEQLFDLAGKTVVGLITGAITVKTGKMLRLGLKSRELNKFGRGSAVVGLVVSGGLTLLYAHEAWVRLRTYQLEASFDPFSVEDEELLESLRLAFAVGPRPAGYTIRHDGDAPAG